ncbi:hypothetical protein TNCV_830651 [Trichonephila clavipes]|nr:hypothetical protein TNCV_830651 [Trichonephila clavipes]
MLDVSQNQALRLITGGVKTVRHWPVGDALLLHHEHRIASHFSLINSTHGPRIITLRSHTALYLTLNVRKNHLWPTALRAIASETISTRYPPVEWLHIYTDGSLLDFIQGAGAEVSCDLFPSTLMSALILLIMTVKSRPFIWPFIIFLSVFLLLDCIPDGVFPIGDDIFVFASTYYYSVSVHIRRFKKYGRTYYPTPKGITLDPRWIEYIMRKKKEPESLEELPSGLFYPERHFQITKQWAEMIENYGAIENTAIDNMFQCMDFLTAYKAFCEGPIENALPSSSDVSLGQQYLTQILKKSICSLLNEKGLKQPHTFAEELSRRNI